MIVIHIPAFGLVFIQLQVENLLARFFSINQPVNEEIS